MSTLVDDPFFFMSLLTTCLKTQLQLWTTESLSSTARSIPPLNVLGALFTSDDFGPDLT